MATHIIRNLPPMSIEDKRRYLSSTSSLQRDYDNVVSFLTYWINTGPIPKKFDVRKKNCDMPPWIVTAMENIDMQIIQQWLAQLGVILKIELQSYITFESSYDGIGIIRLTHNK